MSRNYTVEIEEVGGGLWVVASSNLPNLYVTAPSRDEMLRILPAVVEHLFNDSLGKQVKVAVEADLPWWKRIFFINVSRIQIFGKPDHRELATFAVT